MSPPKVPSDPHYWQRQYWDEMINLKAAASYVDLYRNSRGKWVRNLGILRAVASSSSIAGWALWGNRNFVFVFPTIIAVSQVVDATKDLFPFAKEHKAASAYSITLGYLLNDAQLEWDGIFSGKFTDEEIMKRRHKLRKLRLDAANQNFPDGLWAEPALLEKAREESNIYFDELYGVK
jgi:hypothetical protein